MKLKAKINGKEYDIVQGATFSEEYNETLDSGSIIIDNVDEIEDLKPYDDVIIYDADVDKSNGYLIPGLSSGSYIHRHFYENDGFVTSLIYDTSDSFYKCKVIFSEECINFMKKSFSNNRIYYGNETVSYFTYDKEKDVFTFKEYQYNTNVTIAYSQDDGAWSCAYKVRTEIYDRYKIVDIQTLVNYPVSVSRPKSFRKHLLVDQFSEQLVSITEKKYKYTIDLFSETKGLEVVQLPNVSITQPVKASEKKSVYDYLKLFVDEYSPKIKVSVFNDGTWQYRNKYAISSSLGVSFNRIYAPDFSLTTPSLKDVISQLMLTKDMIPYVKDGVIYGLDITERKSNFNLNKGEVTNILSSMSSSNYADNLYRPYHNALSERSSCHLIEYCGFRNSDNALVTIPNMRIETRYPIYRVNKIYLCYYKRAKVVTTEGTVKGSKVFLCKQDITKLCMLNSARNLLSQDWRSFEALNKSTTSGAIEIDDLAKYQMSTFGYDIGSNEITGWGDIYSHVAGLTGWFTTTMSVIENIGKELDTANPYGIYSAGYVGRTIEEGYILEQTINLESMVSAFSGDNSSQKMKGFFFQVDYEAFYNGTTIISKDGGRDDVSMIDNSSTSLALLEKDGLFQKEKINRFGNKAIQINAIYDKYSDLQELGSIYDDDVVIYHREYSIYANLVQAVYYGTKDYVLKNYFTSVYSQNRPYNLLSYDESVTRAENKRLSVYMSKDNLYYTEESKEITFTNFANGFLADTFSAFKPSTIITSRNVEKTPNRLNASFISFDSGKTLYQSDLNTFVSGYSLCFNARMFDNVSMGVYVDDREPSYFSSTDELQYIGSTQRWYKVVDDNGQVSSPIVYFGKFDSEGYYHDGISDDTDSTIKNEYYENIFKQPKLLDNSKFTKNITVSFSNLLKDNKETLDFTLQIEPLSDDNVAFSPWLMKLSDLITTYNKVDETYEVFDTNVNGVKTTFYWASLEYVYSSAGGLSPVEGHYPAIMMTIPLTAFNDFKNSFTTDGAGIYSAPIMIWDAGDAGGNVSPGIFYDRIGYYSFTPIKIVSVSDTQIIVRGVEFFKYRDTAWLWGNSEATQETDIVLTRATASDPVGHVNFDYNNYAVFSDSFPSLKDKSVQDLYPMTNSKHRNPTIQSRSGYTQYFAITLNASLWLRGGSTGSQDKDNFNSQESKLVHNSGGEKTTYEKNMFVCFSDTKLTKDIIYAEYSGNSNPSGLDTSIKVSSVFYFNKDGYGRPYIVVYIPESKQTSDLKSVSYWYYNSESQSKVFVFGVNLTEDERRIGLAVIYLSALSTKDKRVYNNRMELIGTIENCGGNYTKKYGLSRRYTENENGD